MRDAGRPAPPHFDRRTGHGRLEIDVGMIALWQPQQMFTKCGCMHMGLCFLKHMLLTKPARSASITAMSKMKKQTPAANPDAYVAGLAGWRRELVETLRAAVVNATPLD
jgi:hypothetical protein